MIDKVAVVTGSNKGIGFGTVRELCKRGVKIVYLTARDEGRGRKAVSDLKAEGLNPHFYILDVTDVSTIRKFATHLKQAHGGVDILINNVGVHQMLNLGSNYECLDKIININYRSIVRVQNEFFPIMKQNGRVINITSGWGHIHYLTNQYWVKKLTNEDVTIDDVNDFVNWYLESVKNKSLRGEDFFNHTGNGYKVSKIAMCAATRAQQRMMDQDDRNISINSLHPGSVKTDISFGLGHLSIEESSKAPAYLALDIDQNAKGKFFWYDKQEVNWVNSVDFIRKIFPTVSIKTLTF